MLNPYFDVNVVVVDVVVDYVVVVVEVMSATFYTISLTFNCAVAVLVAV